ncbi:branched chain amino acid aminotransferase [Sporosarcina sp. P37]|nr:MULTISPECIES: branched-chain amino acid aminotransferase [unclassified Sporosarcina]ARD49398.1 branched chain amino acid aminotransferase [Sporosarcina sp. P33]ARK25871.1 branched chain amino acid aminotransferase [Sporosarcina sp. P37]PID19104.1 branched-chain amino acid aminotransferase [Sporosarcina sp. P35]
MTRLPMQIQLTQSKKEKPDPSTLVFGKTFTDHMLIIDYEEGKGWHNHRITPYAPLTLDPAAIVLHYGQTVFEGMKAYRSEDGTIRLFRPDENMKRLNYSLDRLCMPRIDEANALYALNLLLQIEQDWIPALEGTSLYIRPFVIATEAFLGVAPAKKYQFYIILSPVGSYYKEGIHPVKILVENEFVRAAKGGTGSAKTAGNYAAALKAQETADKQGYSQVLWLDSTERKYVEEVGSMNIFFKINGEVVTPAINGSILEGITRKSILQLLRHWNIPVAERKISMDEIRAAYECGELEEVFGTGTAAVISPVGELNWDGYKMIIGNGETGELSAKLYNTLTNIQTGKESDPFDWVYEIKKPIAHLA